MEFDLYFCNDGILRAKWSDKKPLLPLLFIQSKSGRNNLQFWSYWWSCNTYFEDGLTVATFLKCLEPWEEFWGEFIGKDITAYIKEVRKPTLVKDINKEKKAIDWIGLSFKTEISPEIMYEHEVEDLLLWLNSPQKAKLNGDWNIDGYYSLSGYKSGYIEHYSVDSLPLNEIANIPLYLNDKQFLYVSDYKIKESLSEDQTLLNKNGFGIREIPVASGQRKGFKYINANKKNSFRDVVEGFFWWFASTPTRREEFNDELNQIIEEYEQTKDKNKTDVEVIKDTPIKVEIAPNAFSGIIQESNRKKDYWEEMIDEAKKADVVIRIGKCEAVGFPENRIFAYIAKDEDLSTDYL